MTSKVFSQQMKNIQIAPKLQEYWRDKLNDPKHIHHYFDRNKACRITYQTLMGNSNGTCVAESKKRFLKTLHRVQATIAVEMKEDRLPQGKIFHQAIVYYEDGEWRYETYANGIHLDFRVKDKLEIQPWLNFQINWTTSTFKEQKFVEFILKQPFCRGLGQEQDDGRIVEL